MSCETFETMLIDALYEEPGEDASRHLDECPSCAERLRGLRAVRTVAVLPLLEPSADFEDRIMAAAIAALEPAPASSEREVASNDDVRAPAPAAPAPAPKEKRGRVVALFARPELAVAAAFLLVIGAGAALVTTQSRSSPVAASHADKESPAASAVAGEKAPETTTNANEGPIARSDEANAKSITPQTRSARGEPLPPMEAYAQSSPLPAREEGKFSADLPPAPKALGSGRAAGPSAWSGSAFDSALEKYEAGRYGDAFKAFDALAASDPQAALYAARSLERTSGCRAATQRYDEVAKRVPGTAVAHEAELDAARCYQSLGNLVAARDRLNAPLTSPEHQARANDQLRALERKQQQAQRPTAPAAHAAPPATATATVTKPAEGRR